MTEEKRTSDDPTSSEISDREIDEALIESFPASDPPSWTLGTDHHAPPKETQNTTVGKKDSGSADDK
ncbi:MAG: hypothetical protein JWM21_4224 [Acidobacteria bacterium]|nr:hypothetical protein [Acidobacteriota bacterium]